MSALLSIYGKHLLQGFRIYDQSDRVFRMRYGKVSKQNQAQMGSVGNHVFSGWLGNVVKCTVEICTILNASSEILNPSFEKTKRKNRHVHDLSGIEWLGFKLSYR